MAMVYRGERTGEAGFKKKVALKRMLPQYRRDPALLERFAAEARTNARLDHPNLVAVVDFGIEPEPYLVMEFVEGVTLGLLLQRLVEKGEKLELAAACFIGAEAAQGLDHAHRKRDENGNPLGIVHRDVSPQNVLLSNEGSVKVSDFGLVKAADNVVQTGSGIPIGKLSYMAPEQANQQEVDARADVFSLGIVVWEMLTLRTLMPPNDPIATAQMLATCNFPPPSQLNPAVPPQLDAIVMACLAKDPTERTPTAQALGMQLREVLHEIAPGYGRDQLARLLGWVFPERGWQIDEPHATAAQPSMQERMSIPQIPAAEMMARASLPSAEPEHQKTQANVQPAARVEAPRVAVAVAPQKKRGSAIIWVVALIGAGVIGFATLIVLLAAFLFVSTEEEVPPYPDGPPPPMQPNGPSNGSGVEAPRSGLTIASNVPARVFVGTREIGTTPAQLGWDDLAGEPVVAIAAGYQPVIVDAEQLSSALESHLATMSVILVPRDRPDIAVYVEYPQSAVAHVMLSHQRLGRVPGLLLVPRTPLGGTPIIEVLSPGATPARYRTDGCDPSTLCVLGSSGRP
jgi:tRNA A-37 threonylcarbamoyl transferase component Bud32